MLNLNLVLSLNALSCIFFGSLFTLFTPNVADTLGVESSGTWLIQIAGAVLLVFAAHLISSIIRKKKIKLEIYYFSLGDFIWVLGSLAILLGTNWITKGLYYAWFTTALVSIFGVLQVLAANKIS